MGYYSDFKLEIEGDESEISKIKESMKSVVDNNDCKSDLGFYEAATAYIEGDDKDSTKWYDYQEDLKRISEDYPTLLFKLYREGEECRDLEHSYNKNGMSQLCPAIITFEEYDESKLT